MGADGGDLCIPPDAFVRLVFGYRSLDELFDAWPDITIKVESRRLVEVLFPRLDAYFHATYQVFGPDIVKLYNVSGRIHGKTQSIKTAKGKSP